MKVELTDGEAIVVLESLIGNIRWWLRHGDEFVSKYKDKDVSTWWLLHGTLAYAKILPGIPDIDKMDELVLSKEDWEKVDALLK